MGLLSSVASIFGAAKQKKAAGQAANAQIAGAQQGIDTLQNTSNEGQAAIDAIMAQFAPFIQGGTQAFGAQGALAGLGGADAQTGAINSLVTPEYQALAAQGEDALLQNASATGGLRGGNTQAALAQFRPAMLQQLIQQQFSNLGSLSGQGLDALGGAANTQVAGNNQQAQIAELIAGLFGDQGAAKAGGILGKSAATQKMYNGVASIGGDIASAFLPPGVGKFI